MGGKACATPGGHRDARLVCHTHHVSTLFCAPCLPLIMHTCMHAHMDHVQADAHTQTGRDRDSGTHRSTPPEPATPAPLPCDLSGKTHERGRKTALGTRKEGRVITYLARRAPGNEAGCLSVCASLSAPSMSCHRSW